MRKKLNKVEGARIIPMNMERLSIWDPPRMKKTLRDPYCSKPPKCPKKQPHKKTQNNYKRF
jgi:hypothetical protein